MTHRLLVTLVLVAARPPPSVAERVECTPQERFAFLVRRSPPGSLEGVIVHVGGATDRVAGGIIRVCIPGGEQGDVVRVWPDSEGAYAILYPPDGEVVITHKTQVPIYVCEQRGGCARVTALDVELIKQAFHAGERASKSEDLQARLARWIHWLERQQIQNALSERLKRDAETLAVVREKLELLSRFASRAGEAVDSASRHALPWFDHSNEDDTTALRVAIERYRPVVDNVTDKGDAYALDVARVCGEDLAGRFRGLLGEARAIMGRIGELNKVKDLTKACHLRWKECSDRDAARRRVVAWLDEIVPDVKSRLSAFRQHQNAFVEALDDSLFGSREKPGRRAGGLPP